MIYTFQSVDWDTYRMDTRRPHEELEPADCEISTVDGALKTLVQAGVLPHANYDYDKFLAHRAAVREHFDIPWTAITPRMQRLIYAINSIVQPRNMLAAGVYCGNTFISNAGAAVGPGACYSARSLIGVEIVPEEAERAERNVRLIDSSGTARVIAKDAVSVAAEFSEEINLLYLDADGAGGRGKGVYLDIVEACLDRLPPGSIILAHNSVNCAERLQYYLEFVRDPASFRASANVILDPEGLEVSIR